MMRKKRAFIALFVTSLLAATLLLSGCSVNFTLNEDTVNDAVDSATETANNLASAGEEAADAAEMLSRLVKKQPVLWSAIPNRAKLKRNYRPNCY